MPGPLCIKMPTLCQDSSIKRPDDSSVTMLLSCLRRGPASYLQIRKATSIPALPVRVAVKTASWCNRKPIGVRGVRRRLRLPASGCTIADERREAKTEVVLPAILNSNTDRPAVAKKRANSGEIIRSAVLSGICFPVLTLNVPHIIVT
jgi:hypothetical protein